MKKDIILFIVLCITTGALTLIGSVAGHSVGSAGLFIGAIIGGFIGVAVGVWLATRLKVIERRSAGRARMGGYIGFCLAILITLPNLDTALIPVLSILLVGSAAVIGKYSQ